MLQFRAKRQALAQRMYESALAALVAVQRLLPAGVPQETAPEHAAATANGCGGKRRRRRTPVDVHNRIESYFDAGPDPGRAEKRGLAGASN